MRAPANVKFFVWLAILDRCWTAKRRLRHHLQDNANSNLCGQAIESIHHLLLGCVYFGEVWVRLLRSLWAAPPLPDAGCYPGALVARRLSLPSKEA
jgi:hypothetical protein